MRFLMFFVAILLLSNAPSALAAERLSKKGQTATVAEGRMVVRFVGKGEMNGEPICGFSMRIKLRGGRTITNLRFVRAGESDAAVYRYRGERYVVRIDCD